MSSFGDRLAEAVKHNKTPAMVGIDPRVDLLPRAIAQRHGVGQGASERPTARAVEEFCARVLELVSAHVGVVKFQSAFFEVLGAPGIGALHHLVRKARQLGLLTVLDAKRGDIGSTSEAYAQAAFGELTSSVAGQLTAGCNADALTVSPYLGKDSLEPFLNYTRDTDRGLFVLVRTSNPGSRDLQHLTSRESTQPVYRHVAEWVREWSAATLGQSGYGSVGAVVGGTAAEQIGELRAAMPNCWLLIPGYGAQGATAADIACAFDARGLGAVVNNSRGILYPKMEGDPDAAGAWEHAVERALHRMIDDLAEHTPAGQLRQRSNR